MSSIKGHFDGTSVILDEPASLTIGQAVRVVIDSMSSAAPPASPAPKLGAWEGKLRIIDDGDDIVLDHFEDYLP